MNEEHDQSQLSKAKQNVQYLKADWMKAKVHSMTPAVELSPFTMNKQIAN